MAPHLPSATSQTSMTIIKALVELTKPKIVGLLLVTTVPTMFLAKKGLPSLSLIILTVLGGTLSACGANAANMVWDRDIDSIMIRTKNRPMVKRIISVPVATLVAGCLIIAGFLVLYFGVNPLSAWLSLFAALFYVFVYTMLLKRRSSQNIVIGGLAGAIPAIIGYGAVKNSISLSAILFAGVIFLWTPAHFWALAVKYKRDYENAKIPMLPTVTTMRSTSYHIFAYTLLTAICVQIAGFVAHLGIVYQIICSLSNLGFLFVSLELIKKRNALAAMRVFLYSMLYLAIVFIGIVPSIYLTRVL